MSLLEEHPSRQDHSLQVAAARPSVDDLITSGALTFRPISMEDGDRAFMVMMVHLLHDVQLRRIEDPERRRDLQRKLEADIETVLPSGDRDFGVIAALHGEPIGSAWCRYPGPGSPSYYGPDIPGRAIAVLEEYQGMGAGGGVGISTLLIRANIVMAAERGVRFIHSSILGYNKKSSKSIGKQPLRTYIGSATRTDENTGEPVTRDSYLTVVPEKRDSGDGARLNYQPWASEFPEFQPLRLVRDANSPEGYRYEDDPTMLPIAYLPCPATDSWPHSPDPEQVLYVPDLEHALDTDGPELINAEPCLGARLFRNRWSSYLGALRVAGRVLAINTKTTPIVLHIDHENIVPTKPVVRAIAGRAVIVADRIEDHLTSAGPIRVDHTPNHMPPLFPGADPVNLLPHQTLHRHDRSRLNQ